MTGKEKSLKWIAEQSAAIDNHPDVFSCTWIAKDIGEPVRKVRQYMKELEAEGYVEKAHEGGVDDWNARIFCIHGYALTKKGAETEYFKERQKADMDWWNESLKRVAAEELDAQEAEQ